MSNRISRPLMYMDATEAEKLADAQEVLREQRDRTDDLLVRSRAEFLLLILYRYQEAQEGNATLERIAFNKP